MKKLFATAALAALAFPAFAGGKDSLVAGYRCENACPLAEKANHCRAYGMEAPRSSEIARADVARVVVGNLARI